MSTYVQVWDDHGGYVCVVPSDEPSIDAAVGHWLDRLLHLTTTSGDTFVTRASRIGCWMLSTPEGRAAGVAIEKAGIDEERENRVAVGLPWDEE